MLQRQVTVHPRAIGPGERARQIQHARKREPCATRAGSLVCHDTRAWPWASALAKWMSLACTAMRLALQLPAHIGAEFVQRQHGVFKHAGQHQGTGLDGQGGLAAGPGSGQIPRWRCASPAYGSPLSGGPGQREACTCPLHLVLLQGVERPFQVAWISCTMPGAHRWQWHRGLRKTGAGGWQSGPARPGPACRRGTRLAQGPARSLGVLQLEVATRPVQAIVGPNCSPG